MQKCKECGKEIRFVAIAPGKCVVCEPELVPFVTENGRKTYGYLIHKCEEPENENAKTR